VSFSPALAAALNAMAPTPKTDLYAHARARALMVGYDERWSGKWQHYDIIEVEHEFTFPLLNPETEGTSRTFVEAGKIDVKVRNRANGQLGVIEHKTTQDPVDAASDYWDRLRMDPQVSKYFIGTAQFGEEVGEVIYDVIRKPAQRMTNIPLLDADGVKIVRDANGERVRTKDGKKWRESADAAAGFVMDTRPERPDEHEARVLAVIREDPERFYGQRKVTRMDSDILEFMNDEWSLSQQILYFRNRSLWPRNPAACNAYGTCEFFDLCCGRVTVDGVNYRPRERAHAELTIQGHNGLELLTNSRATALRKCARYHQHRYETPIERVGGEESEALFFGTLIHRGLEAYFNSLKSNVHQD
jgi:hypothetical protein